MFHYIYIYYAVCHIFIQFLCYRQDDSPQWVLSHICSPWSKAFSQLDIYCWDLFDLAGETVCRGKISAIQSFRAWPEVWDLRVRIGILKPFSVSSFGLINHLLYSWVRRGWWWFVRAVFRSGLDQQFRSLCRSFLINPYQIFLKKGQTN